METTVPVVEVTTTKIVANQPIRIFNNYLRDLDRIASRHKLKMLIESEKRSEEVEEKVRDAYSILMRPITRVSELRKSVQPEKMQKLTDFREKLKRREIKFVTRPTSTTPQRKSPEEIQRIHTQITLRVGKTRNRPKYEQLVLDAHISKVSSKPDKDELEKELERMKEQYEYEVIDEDQIKIQLGRRIIELVSNSYDISHNSNIDHIAIAKKMIEYARAYHGDENIEVEVYDRLGVLGLSLNEIVSILYNKDGGLLSRLTKKIDLSEVHQSEININMFDHTLQMKQIDKKIQASEKNIKKNEIQKNINDLKLRVLATPEQKEDLDNLGNEFLALNDKINNLETQVKSSEANLYDSNEEKSRLIEDLEEKKNNIKNLEKKIEEYENIEQANATLEIELSDKQTELKTKTEEVNRLQSELDVLDRDSEDYKAKNDLLENAKQKVKKLNTDIKTKTTTITELTTQLEETKTQKEIDENTIRIHKESISDLEIQLREKDNELHILKSDHQKIMIAKNKVIKELEERNIQHEKLINTLRDQVREEMNKTEKMTEEKKETERRLNIMIKGLDEELAKLKTDLETEKNDMQSNLTEINDLLQKIEDQKYTTDAERLAQEKKIFNLNEEKNGLTVELGKKDENIRLLKENRIELIRKYKTEVQNIETRLNKKIEKYKNAIIETDLKHDEYKLRTDKEKNELMANLHSVNLTLETKIIEQRMAKKEIVRLNRGVDYLEYTLEIRSQMITKQRNALEVATQEISDLKKDQIVKQQMLEKSWAERAVGETDMNRLNTLKSQMQTDFDENIRKKTLYLTELENKLNLSTSEYNSLKNNFEDLTEKYSNALITIERGNQQVESLRNDITQLTEQLDEKNRILDEIVHYIKGIETGDISIMEHLKSVTGGNDVIIFLRNYMNHNNSISEENRNYKERLERLENEKRAQINAAINGIRHQMNETFYTIEIYNKTIQDLKFILNEEEINMIQHELSSDIKEITDKSQKSRLIIQKLKLGHELSRDEQNWVDDVERHEDHPLHKDIKIIDSNNFIKALQNTITDLENANKILTIENTSLKRKYDSSSRFDKAYNDTLDENARLLKESHFLHKKLSNYNVLVREVECLQQNLTNEEGSNKRLLVENDKLRKKAPPDPKYEIKKLTTMIENQKKTVAYQKNEINKLKNIIGKREKPVVQKYEIKKYTHIIDEFDMFIEYSYEKNEREEQIRKIIANNLRKFTDENLDTSFINDIVDYFIQNLPGYWGSVPDHHAIGFSIYNNLQLFREKYKFVSENAANFGLDRLEMFGYMYLDKIHDIPPEFEKELQKLKGDSLFVNKYKFGLTQPITPYYRKYNILTILYNNLLKKDKKIGSDKYMDLRRWIETQKTYYTKGASERILGYTSESIDKTDLISNLASKIVDLRKVGKFNMIVYD